MDQAQHSANAFAERRRFARYSLRLRVNYAKHNETAPISDQIESTTRDLGAGGIALIVHEQLEPGQILKVKIDLPYIADLFSDKEESMSAAEKTVTLVSRVAWCRPHENNQFLVGVQFLNLEHADSQVLKDFLEEYSLQENIATNNQIA